VSPRFAGRRLRWRSRAGRCWLIDWMISRWSWRQSWCTCRGRPLLWQLPRGDHLRSALTTLVQVISLPWWPISWIAVPCAAGRLQTVGDIEWRLVIKLFRAWKWLQLRRLNVLLRWIILIGVFVKFTIFASGMSQTFIW
jgi:hypothetical protein